MILQALRQQQQQLIDFTVDLAKINSGSYNITGIQQVADYIVEYALNKLKLNCDFEIIKLANQAPVVRLSHNIASNNFSILLMGHMDTVFGPKHSFQQVKVAKDKLYGPGVADMKGGIAVMLHALAAWQQFSQGNTNQGNISKNNNTVKKDSCGNKDSKDSKDSNFDNLGWEVLLTPDEEIGSLGSATIITETAKRHNLGFIFEPTLNPTGTLAGTRKGSGKFSWIMHGKAAHAGRNMAAGKNAICALTSIIDHLNSLNNQRKGLTINIGYIQGGEAVNVVPATCLCKIDVRLVNADDKLWLEQQFTNILNSFNNDPNNSGYKLELQGQFTREPKIVTGKLLALYEQIKGIAAELGQELTWQATGGCCDGNNLMAAGLLNIDTLGVRGDYIHSEREYCIIDSLVERSLLLFHILKNAYCLFSRISL